MRRVGLFLLAMIWHGHKGSGFAVQGDPLLIAFRHHNNNVQLQSERPRGRRPGDATVPVSPSDHIEVVASDPPEKADMQELKQKTPRRVSWCCTLKCAKGEVTSVEEGHDVERVTDDAGETTSAMAKLPRDIDESASDVIGSEWALMVWLSRPFRHVFSAHTTCVAFRPSCDIVISRALVDKKTSYH